MLKILDEYKLLYMLNKTKLPSYSLYCREICLIPIQVEYDETFQLHIDRRVSEEIMKCAAVNLNPESFTVGTYEVSHYLDDIFHTWWQMFISLKVSGLLANVYFESSQLFIDI